MRFTTVLAAGLIAAATALSPVGEGALAQTPRDTVVMAKQIDDIVSLDPAESFEASGGEVIGNVYDRLLSFDVKDPSKLQGELAASWSVSADGKTLTFKIRPGVKFASGNQVTAQDVAYSFQRTVALNKSPAFIITQFGLTKDNVAQRARAVDDSTFVLEIDKPFAPTFVLNCLTSAPASIVDAKLVKANEKDGDWGNAWLKQNSAGSGAYTLRVYRAGEQYTLDAHAGWYKGASKNRRVVVRHVPEPASQRLLIEKGDVDLARSLTKDQVEALRGSANVVIDSGVKGYLLYLGLNQKHPILSKPEVREALKLLVDYDAIERNILAGTYIQQQAFLPQGLFGAIKDRPYRFDVAKAKELLAKAGHPNGFAITMDVRSVSPITEVAQAIQASWGQAGVKMEILPGDGRQVLTKYRARNHEVFIGRWGIDYPDPHTNAEQFAMNEDNSENARSKTLSWRNAWDIPEMSKVTAAAVLERDGEKRQATYEALQREGFRVSPFVMMFQEIEVAARRRGVEGYVIGPTSDTNYFWNITKN